MDYIRLSFRVSGDTREILIAYLSEAGCESFEETDEMLHAFLPADNYDRDTISRIAQESNTTFTLSSIPQQNWNAAWESSFEPVTVPGFCTVRASFHDTNPDALHDIIITPKMSFGTGHHATTRLMLAAMRDIDFYGRRVLDLGTGTGILAILAELLGAAEVVAIDNDEWSVENAAENVATNNVQKVRIVQGSLEEAGAESFDVILANINRHVLLQYMLQMRSLLTTGGILLLSGILIADERLITASALGNGFIKSVVLIEGDWIAVKFVA